MPSHNRQKLGKNTYVKGTLAEGLTAQDITKEKADIIYRDGCMLSFNPKVQGATPLIHLNRQPHL